MAKISDLLKGGTDPWLPQADRVIDICRQMYPVRGLIASPDISRAFDQLKAAYPWIKLHKYPTGAMAEDWEVPALWEATKGVLSDEDGRVLASLDESFLFVAANSEPVDGWFTKAEIAPRARTRPDYPSAYMLEHRNAYNYQLVDWGITLPDAVWQKMSDDKRYHVVIETRTAPGHLVVADAFLPGRRTETICICSQFDELCNDGQSSAVLGAQLFEYLRSLPDRQFSYHLLLVPEMFGTLFFAHHNAQLLENTVGMLNLETLGVGEGWVLKKALKDGGSLEQALAAAFQATKIPFSEYDFFGALSNDEKVYSWPGIGVPGVALQRFPFREYHTSLDTPELLKREHLAEALLLSAVTLQILEQNGVPQYAGRLPPWLTKHNLYFDSILDPATFRKFNQELLYNIDGTKSVLRLVREIELPLDVTLNYVSQFEDRSLIKSRPLTFAELRAGI